MGWRAARGEHREARWAQSKGSISRAPGSMEATWEHTSHMFWKFAFIAVI